jgi:hypothetical protein
MIPDIQLGESFGVELRGAQDDCLCHLKKMWVLVDGRYSEGIIVAMYGYKNADSSWQMHFNVRYSRSPRNRKETTHRMKIRHKDILEKFPNIKKYPSGRVEYRVDTKRWGATDGALHAWIREIIPGRIDKEGPKGVIYPQLV